MYIVEAKLKNYKRLFLSDIKELDYKPKMKIQSIIGQNGSGKTSLLKEMLPNVSDTKDDYEEKGFKEVTYSHRGDSIKVSYYRDINSHSFIVNDKELNQTGQISIQRKLIEQYFNITKEIHEMLLSVNTFTNMSTNERKKWFTEILSDIDYEYILKVYEKTKTKTRDLVAYIKLIRTKILKDESYIKKVDLDYEKNLIDKIQILHIILDKLLNSKKEVKIVDTDKFKRYLLYLISENKEILKTLFKENISSLKDLSTTIEKSKLKLDFLLEENSNINKKILEIPNIVVSEDFDSTENKKRLAFLKMKKVLKNKKNKENLGLDLENIDKIKQDFENHISYINDIGININFLDIDFSKKDKNENVYLSSSEKLKYLNNKITLLQSEIKALEEVSKDKVECPKCSNIFIPNFSEKELENYKKELETILKDKDILNKTFLEAEDFKDKYNIYIENLNLIKKYFNYLTEPILYFILKETNNLKNCNNLNNVIMDITNFINEVDNYNNITIEINKIENDLELMNKLKDEKHKDKIIKLKELENRYGENIIDINNLKEKIVKSTKIKNKIIKLKEVNDKIESLLKKTRAIYKNKSNGVRNDFIDETVVLLKEEVRELEVELIEIKNIRNRYDNLILELKDYENKLRINKKILESLSPNKGLIGKSIVGLINDFSSRMNIIINKVWTYRIEILPVDLEKSNLNFRFPVRLGDKKEISDISKGSNGIRDIIDMAFKVVAMEYLDMLDYPLILDEYGRTYDELHRIKAYDLIDELSKDYFSQIFMISHFVSMYDRFTNIDMIVLNNDNVNYDKPYNEVIEIK